MALFSYCLLAIIQKSVYLKLAKWNIRLEIASLVFFYLIYLIGIYGYYKSPLIAGGYSFFQLDVEIIRK